MRQGFMVTGPDIVGAHPTIERYFLMEGDLLVEDPDGTYTKECPGVTVGGFRLTEEQKERLRPVEFENEGLSYVLTNPEDLAWYKSLEE